MPGEKPLTKSDLVAALKEIGVATKADIQETEKRLNQNIGTVEENLNQRISATEERLNRNITSVEERLKQYITDVVTESDTNIITGVEVMFEERDQQFEHLDKGQAQIKTELSHIKDDLKGLKADLSGKASRAELKELAERVNRYHPAH